MNPTVLAEWVLVLRNGGVVACPTETQFGLLADARSETAVNRVIELKGRGEEHPIAVLLPRPEAISQVAEPLDPDVEHWVSRYWPGPLTIVTWARHDVPRPLKKDGKIGLRVPGQSVALELTQAFGGALTATSANVTGQPAANRDVEVRQQFGSRLDAIVPGRAPGGPPSTVIDVTVDPPKILRAGACLVTELS